MSTHAQTHFYTVHFQNGPKLSHTHPFNLPPLVCVFPRTPISFLLPDSAWITGSSRAPPGRGGATAGESLCSPRSLARSGPRACCRGAGSSARSSRPVPPIPGFPASGQGPLPADRYLAHRKAARRLQQETLRLAAEKQPRVPSLALAALLPSSPARAPRSSAPERRSPRPALARRSCRGAGDLRAGEQSGRRQRGCRGRRVGRRSDRQRSEHTPAPGAHLAPHLLNSPPVQRPRVGLRRWPPREVRPRAPGAATGFLLPVPPFPLVSGRRVARKSLVRASSYRFSSWDWLVCASCTGGHPP